MTTKLTKETILKTRQWFADNAQACIDEVKRGEVKVNDELGYFARCEQRKTDAIAGMIDHSLTFKQRAIMIQTGFCHPILPL